MPDFHYYVYILTRERNSIFYVGVTNNLVRRVYEHKMGLIESINPEWRDLYYDLEDESSY